MFYTNVCLLLLNHSQQSMKTRPVSKVIDVFQRTCSCLLIITFTFSHLADAFIQSDLQLGVHKAINLEEVNIQRKCQ